MSREQAEMRRRLSGQRGCCLGVPGLPSTCFMVNPQDNVESLVFYQRLGTQQDASKATWQDSDKVRVTRLLLPWASCVHNRGDTGLHPPSHQCPLLSQVLLLFPVVLRVDIAP